MSFKVGDKVFCNKMNFQPNKVMVGKVFEIIGLVNQGRWNEIIYLKTLDNGPLLYPGAWDSNKFRLATPSEINNALFYDKLESIIDE